MERQISFDQFCPVCYDIPSAEIFQCKNGHTICNSCSKLVSICPQCREPFAEEMSRCLVLEKILNGQNFDCPNKELGCKVRTLRQDMPKHSTDCLFREMSANLCQSLGYNCEFVVYSTKIEAALLHFETVHNINCQQGSTGKIILENFSGAPINKTNVWSPCIFQNLTTNSSDPETFLVAATTNGSNQTTSFIGILLSGQGKSSTDYSIQFSISPHSTQMQLLQWTNPPTMLSQAETVLNVPFLQIPGSLLSTHFTKANVLEVNICITKTATNVLDVVVEPGTSPVVICGPVDEIRGASDSIRLGELEEAKSEIFVNSGVSCDECGARNFMGTRHSCLQCQNFDMCDPCKKLGKHSHHLLLPVRGWSETVTLRKLKLDKVTAKWKPLLSADIIVENCELCSECKQNDGTNPVIGICSTCLPFYGLCRTCFRNEGERASCRNHNWWYSDL